MDDSIPMATPPSSQAEATSWRTRW
jgi:hypothetical protein